MHILSIFTTTTTNLKRFPKKLTTWGDSNPGILFFLADGMTTVPTGLLKTTALYSTNVF
jgi:hypothetical protein